MWIGLGLSLDGVEVSREPGPAPGPMDYVADSSGLSNITTEYNLASSVAVMAIAAKYIGTVTSLTVTHGGESLEPIQVSNNTNERIFTGLYAGAGLTIEPANLVVTPVGGGTIGPAVMRINDDYGPAPIQSDWSAGQHGLGYRNDLGVMTVSGVGGTGIVAYALGCNVVSPLPYTGPSTQYTTSLSAFAMVGARVDVPAFTGGIQWSEVDGWWTHTGTTTSVDGPNMSADLPAPFGYELEVDVPEGASLSIQLMRPDGTYMTQSIRVATSGVVRFYHNESGFIGLRWRMLGTGPVRFRNLRYVVSPVTVQGIFGRGTQSAVNDLRVWFYFGAASQFAGVAAEVHQ